jgi:polyphosphate kinase 2 (PPK2 family)
MAKRNIGKSDDKFFGERYEQVKNFEQYLYENSYRVIKVFIHVSKDEQTEQLLERLEIPEKNWKFSSADLGVRDKFDSYLKCFNEVINKTSTGNAPWYVLPGDQRWYTRYLMTEILLSVMEDCKPEYPVLPDEEKEKMDECRTLLREALEKSSGTKKKSGKKKK